MDDKEKKMIDRIVIEATTLKNGWKYDEYEKKIIEWLAIDPSNLELTRMLADYYFTIWSYKKALPLLKKIIEREPEDDKSLWQIWEIYFINGDNWTAELLIDKAVNLRPDSPKYNLSLVEIYYNTWQNYGGYLMYGKSNKTQTYEYKLSFHFSNASMKRFEM